MRSVLRVDLQLTSGEDRTGVYKGEGIQIMRVRLAAGGALPHHNANANVVLIPLQGQIRFANEEADETVGVGEALAVAFDTPMDVSNVAEGETIFLVVKTEPKS